MNAIKQFYEENKEYAGNELRIKCIITNSERYYKSEYHKLFKYSAL